MTAVTECSVTAEDQSIQIARLQEKLVAEICLRASIIKQMEEAREHQAVEYARRLADLNQSHERIDKIVAELPTRERVEMYIDNHNKMHERLREEDAHWKTGVGEQLAEYRGASARQAMLVSIGLTALVVVSKFWP